MFLSVGDIIQLIKVANDIYQKGFLVIKNAPEIFGSLLLELRVIRDILYRIQVRIREQRQIPENAALNLALQSCNDAFYRFKPLVEKYKKLGSSGSSAKFRRLCLPFDEGKLQECKKGLEDATRILTTVLSAEAAFGPLDDPMQDPSSALSPTAALRRNTSNNATPSTASSHVDSSRLLDRSPSMPNAFPTNRVQTVGSEYELEAVTTVAPLDTPRVAAIDPPRSPPAFLHRLTHSDPPRSTPRSAVGPVGIPTTADVLSGLTSVGPSSSTHLSPQHRPDPITSASADRSSGTSSLEVRVSPDAHSTLSGSSMTSEGSQSPLAKAAEQALAKNRRQSSMSSMERFKLIFPTDEDADESNLEEMRLDFTHRLEIKRKLDADPTFRALEPEFEQHAHPFVDELGLSDCLNYAVWWLLKSRNITRILDKHPSKPNLGDDDWRVLVSKHQAAADLLKSFWLLKNVAFAPESVGRAISNATWKTLCDLAESILFELTRKETVKIFAGEIERIKEQNLSFKEPLSQAVEQHCKVPAALDILEPPSRWYTVDDRDAGMHGEHVLYRTFVNAMIGSRNGRRKTMEAPYMFILWSKAGRSEVLVSLINQCGTIGLCSPLTHEHLSRHDQHTGSALEFEMNFPTQEKTSIRFLDVQDLRAMLEVPRRFFAAMNDRQPHQDEFLISREGLESFSHIDLTKRAQPGQARDDLTRAHSSCEVSLFARVPSECWKTERRLVVSSALDAPRPWCRSFWLPLGDINVFRRQRDVTLTWADLSQLETVSDGNFGFHFSYTYQPDSPNNTVHIRFESEDIASEFVSDVLRPWVWPFHMESLEHIAIYGSLSAEDMAMKVPPTGKEIRVWSIRDTEDAVAQRYLSVVSTEKQPNGGFMTSVYFILRDVDFTIESDQFAVHFPSLLIPHYKSNITGYRRPPAEKPVYEDATWALEGQAFHFSDELSMSSFLNNLTRWEIKYSCRAVALQVSHHHRSTVKQKNVMVTLWENPSKRGHFTGECRLTVRCLGQRTKKDEPVWTTIQLAPDSDYNDNTSRNQFVLKKATVCLGDRLDITSLNASDLWSSKPRSDRVVVLTMMDAQVSRQLRARVDACLNTHSEPQDMFLPYRASGLSSDVSGLESHSRLGIFQFGVPMHR